MAKTGRKSKYETHIAPHLEQIRTAVKNGATVKEIADALGIAESTLNKYKAEKTELSAAFACGRANIIIDIRAALLKKALGYEYQEKKQYIRKDEKGENVTYTEITTKHQPPSEAIAEIFRMMETKETKVLFVPSKETFVFSGESKAYNEEYCKENNIPIYPLYTGGGTIVSTEGDFSLVICYPENTAANVHFILEKLKEIFDITMPNVTISGNDILSDGMKICGSVMYQQNGMKCFAAHFSFKDNSELIKQICGVSGSIKTPTTIDGLTVDMFKKAVREWLRIQ